MKIKLYLLVIFLIGVVRITAKADEKKIIRIETDNISLIYGTNKDGRLYQTYLGQRLHHDSDAVHLPLMGEACLTHGMEDYFEPAVRILHNDGNPSLLLKYVSHEIRQLQPDVNETVIRLRDDVYPVEVQLCYVSYVKENIIKAYTEISHREKKAVTLYRYDSSLLHVMGEKYYLTEFSGDWAREVNMTEQPLAFGKKILDTKLGSRANMFCSPFFLLSLDKVAEENSGEILFGTIAWTGNFHFTFEINQQNQLRILSGINPYASEYSLAPDEIFRTPEFIFTYSTEGKGKASRDFHRWARKYQLKDGEKPRLTLLNNWETTAFNFNEEKLATIMDEAVKLGVDMFLLDDGWFGNKHPRNSDKQGLGDWEVTTAKLPNGIEKLVQEASKREIKFGLWIEPEMVNPRSELYEQHKDWVIRFPNRKEYYFRNQMVLDLSNPKVQDFVFGIVDNLMRKYPDIAYFKWDCNSPITNIYSPYLKDKQSHLYIEHVRGLYNILERVKQKYPDVPMMLCSGGGGRSDYKALSYFTEFWPSDNTDAVERIFIQWGYGHFFPSKTLAAHVTSWGKQPVKFRTDVAMMGKLGFDIRMNEMNLKEQEYCRNAVKNFKRLEYVIGEGDMYRLISPYRSNHAAVMYVSENKKTSVLFAFDIHPRYGERIYPLRLEGLNPNKIYKIKEINLLPDTKSILACNEQTYSGEYLMKVGLTVFSSAHTVSKIIEISQNDIE
ncbi:Alpha-galactosidase [termite gut metagenome]|uniref:alpha-galactosidase n=1 Tax=termite gut metagenome TaxID=433724 RepID=A0A5J4SFD9_9ZZZZ